MGQSKPKHIIYYDNSHLAVLFQSHGSIFPLVLPYCLVNVLITFGIYYLKHVGVDTSFSDKGHGFMAIMVSFLVVTRCQIVYNRFMEARFLLGDILRSARELVSHVCVLTANRTDEATKQWRLEVTYQTIVLLRIAIKALAYNDTKKDVWETERKEIRQMLRANNRIKLRRDAKDAVMQDNLNAPIMVALNLRKVIISQRDTCCKGNPLDIKEEMKFLSFVEDFFTAYSGLIKLVTTPFPFPLVQMARSFLFIWVFSLPFALTFTELYDPIQIMLEIFFITFGFVGIEQVSMALDDPFGDDPTDFDDERLLKVSIQDIMITIFHTDGESSLKELQSRSKADARHHLRKKTEDFISMRSLKINLQSFEDDDDDYGLNEENNNRDGEILPLLGSTTETV